MKFRRYDAEQDAESLWELKRRFERELGTLGGAEKSDTYGGKLTEGYRERYLDWVARCVERDPDCVTVADSPDTDRLVGYVFVLPEELSLIWDGGVLNELYVAEPHRGTALVDDLMDAAVECAENQNLPIDRLMLDVNPGNEPAQGVYERHGFEPWGELLARDL